MRGLKEKWGIAILIAFVFFMFYEPVVCGIILGVCVLVFGIVSWRFLSHIQSKGVKTWGVIASFEQDGDGAHIPVVEYVTKDKRTLRGKPYFYAYAPVTKVRNPDKHIGKKTLVMYDPDDVNRFVMKGDAGFYRFVAVLATGIGLVVIVMATAFLLGFVH